MNADRAAAFRAGPPDLFAGNKLSDPKLSDIFEILEHAHAVTGPVSLIQVLQTRAGKLLTRKAKPWFSILERFAILNPAFHAVARFIDVVPAAAGTFLFVPQIRHTDAAVHSAGSDVGSCDHGCYNISPSN